MVRDSFSKLLYGMFFIMIGFKIGGVDIFPDIVGYILFALGLSELSKHNEFFDKARKFNYPMIIISIFLIYQAPSRQNGINTNPLGFFSLAISIAEIVLNLLIIYNILMGIKDMAGLQGRYDIVEESDKRWTQYVMLQIGVFAAFIIALIPVINILYVIALLIFSIALAVMMMNLMRRCSENLN